LNHLCKIHVVVVLLILSRSTFLQRKPSISMALWSTALEKQVVLEKYICQCYALERHFSIVPLIFQYWWKL